MKINYEDLVRINAELKKKNNRFHLSYRDESTACVEPPGECCRTEQMETSCLALHRENGDCQQYERTYCHPEKGHIHTVHQRLISIGRCGIGADRCHDPDKYSGTDGAGDGTEGSQQR